MRCFLTGPADVDLSRLADMVNGLDMEVVRPEQVADEASLLARLTSAVLSSDCLLAVLPGRNPSPGVMLEIGIAASVRVPILLLVAGEDAIPSALRELPFVALRDGIETDALAMHLLEFARRSARRRLAEAPGAGETARRGPGIVAEDMGSYHVGRPVGDRDLLGVLRDRDRAGERRLAEVVAALLVARGDMVRSVPEGAAADLAVWMPDLDASALNPVLVEVKGGGGRERPVVSAAAVDLGISQLRFALHTTGAGCGLLLAPDAPAASHPGTPVHVADFGPRPIFVLALEDFAVGLEEGRLSHWILAARDIAAHGA